MAQERRGVENCRGRPPMLQASATHAARFAKLGAMPKKGTSPRVASLAGRQLRSNKSTAAQKSVAADALAEVARKKAASQKKAAPAKKTPKKPA